MKRKVLLVDDEVAILLTMKAVLEISGFDVDTAASAREGVSKLHTREYSMLITDMRMESDEAGVEVIRAARTAAYHPAIALLTAYPVAEEDWQEMGADQLLVKPMHTRELLSQIEALLESHENKMGVTVPGAAVKKAAGKKSAVKKSAVKKAAGKKAAGKKPAATKKAAAKKAPAKKAAPARAAAKSTARKTVKKAAVGRVPAKKAVKR